MKGMKNMYNEYRAPHYDNIPIYPDNMGTVHPMYGCPLVNTPMYNSYFAKQIPYRNPYSNEAEQGVPIVLKDHGPEPFAVNIAEVTKRNNTYRTALWTGCHLQLTLMCIKVGEDIGLEVHPHLDQFIRIEEGQALVQMGDNRHDLNFQRNVGDDFALFIPAGKWHNLINTGDKPIKLYSIYAPPQHPHGTIQKKKPIADAAG
jgi:Mannose-6-phosphate isomerase